MRDHSLADLCQNPLFAVGDMRVDDEQVLLVEVVGCDYGRPSLLGVEGDEVGAALLLEQTTTPRPSISVWADGRVPIGVRLISDIG